MNEKYITKKQLIESIESVIHEQGPWASLRKALFGGKEVSSAAKTASVLSRDFRPFLKDILAAKPTIKMTPKVKSVFAKPLEDIKFVKKYLDELISVMNKGRGGVPAPLSIPQAKLEKIISDFSKADGTSIPLRAHMETLNSLINDFRGAQPGLSVKNLKGWNPEMSNVIKFKTEALPMYLDNATRDLEDIILMAVSNMKKAK